LTDLIRTEKGNFESVESKQLATTFKVNDFHYGRYFLPSTLGHSEHEDIAARLIEMAHQEGKWVGVAYPALMNELVKEFQNQWQEVKVPKKTGLFGKKEEEVHLQSKPAKEGEEAPFSVLSSLPQMLQNAPNEVVAMVDQGLLQKKHFDGKFEFANADGEKKTIEGCDVLFPTEKMLQMIYDRQHGNVPKPKAPVKG